MFIFLKLVYVQQEERRLTSRSLLAVESENASAEKKRKETKKKKKEKRPQTKEPLRKVTHS